VKTNEAGSLMWTKSRASGNSGCVEVSTDGEAVLLRDSKDRRGPILAFTVYEWVAFLAGVRAGEFDLGGTALAGVAAACTGSTSIGWPSAAPETLAHVGELR
jgi:hypothetical protein